MDNNKEIVFLIVPIGNYKGWDKVKYKLLYIDKFSNTNIAVEMESKTSMKIIQKAFNPDKTIFILSDSLIDNVSIDLIKNLNKDNSHKYDFDKIKQLIKEDIINNLLLPEGIEFDDDSFIISFGKGFFPNTKEAKKKATRIIGNSDDFYYFVFFSLANLFFDTIIKSNKIQNINQIKDINLKVIIDTTHGVNYQPVLIYKSVLELLKIFAFCFRNVVLWVFNSDPYINPNISKEFPYQRILNINLIENTKIIPFFNIFKSSNNKFLAKSVYYNENIDENYLKEFTNIENVSKEFITNLYSFAASFIFGFPLYAIYFIPNSEELYNIILKVFNKHLDSIDFVFNENEDSFEIFINRKLTFTLEFENLIKIYILSKLLNLLNIQQKSEITTNEINEFNDLIYKKYFPLEYNRNSEELRNLEKNINNLQKNNPSIDLSSWMLYNYLMKHHNKTISKRNFFAHSGFEYNSILVKKISDIIYLKPNQKEIKIIKESILINSLSNINK